MKNTGIHISLDHLKMGMIRGGLTRLTPVSDDKALTDCMWSIVREIIKTVIENRQNLFIEGCYIPFDWKKDFSDTYLPHIKYLCLVMSRRYIREHYDDIIHYENVVEHRAVDGDCTQESLMADNAAFMEM